MAEAVHFFVSEKVEVDSMVSVQDVKRERIAEMA
jgi:hypothetical protein